MAESDLYPGVHDYLELRFRDRLKPAFGELRTISAVTATAGGAASGHWSRPDLTLAALSRSKYGLAWSLHLHGFEVKTRTGCTPAAVHEALSHAAMVHFAHLVWHRSDWNEREAECKAILDRCARYGIGLITFADPENSDSFSVRLDAGRHNPSAEAIDEFIETRFSNAHRERLLGWIEELR
jgi:hypothetical protein